MQPAAPPPSAPRAARTLTSEHFSELADAALYEGEERFRHLADHSPVMAWTTGPGGQCSFVSRGCLTFTGQTAEQALAGGRYAAIHPDDRDRVRGTFGTALARHETFRVEYRLRRQDGEWRRALDLAHPRYGPDGAFEGYVGSIVDITERG